MEIIQFTENMKEDILAFFKKCFKENSRTFNIQNKESDLLDIKTNYLSRGNFWCLINSKKKICGTIALREIDEFFEIRRFFILKKYQGAGYGTKLLNIAINYAIDNNIKLLKAATMNNGCRAIHIFLKAGFKKTTQYNNSSADLFFELPLSRENVYNYKISYLKQQFDTSLILNPTENIPFVYSSKTSSDFLSGLYVSERFKDVNDKVIFGGRNDYIHFFEYVKSEWKKELNAYDVDLKTLSGLNAHLILFLCILKPGDKVMILPEVCGGHFATEQILKNIGTVTYQMIPDLDNYSVDINQTLNIINTEKINYVFVDRSEGLYYEDFSWLNQCTSCYKIFDASQYSASIICGHFPNPFDMGFDMLVTTLHKNFPGPQKGLLAVKRKDDEVWMKYLQNAKTYISNTHPRAIGDSLLPLLRKDSFENYCTLCKQCTRLLEIELNKNGVPVIMKKERKYQTHHIWILCENKYESYRFYLKLESLGLLTNYRLLPYELGYGLRIGLNGAILSGLKEKHISELANIMGNAYHNDITHSLRRCCNSFIKKIKSTA